MAFNEVNCFELEDTITWGVKYYRFSGGFSISVVVDDETKTKIKSLVKEHDTRSPLYGDTLYLKSKNLSDKQKKSY